MSKGKYYSLEEARQEKDLEGFAKEHPSKGDKEKFDNILEAMALNKPAKEDDKPKKV